MDDLFKRAEKDRATIEYFVPRRPLDTPTGSMNCDASEIQFFDSIAEEYGRRGIPVEYYRQDESQSDFDPLYCEPRSRVWLGPYTFMALADGLDGNTPNAVEAGFEQTMEGTIFIARVEFEKARVAYPNEGDIVRIMNLPYLNGPGFAYGDGAKSGVYLDVIDVDPTGMVFSGGEFVGFSLSVNRRSEDPPERRLSLP